MRQGLKVTSTYQVVTRQSSPEAEVLLGSDLDVACRKFRGMYSWSSSKPRSVDRLTCRSVSPAFSNLLKLTKAFNAPKENPKITKLQISAKSNSMKENVKSARDTNVNGNLS